MTRRQIPGWSFPMKKTRGVTLTEVMVALAILGVALFPLIRVFSQSYSITSKQAFQEQALKIGEAAIAKLMAVRFDDLDKPSASVNLPFEVVTTSGSLNGQITLAGNPALGTGSVNIGKVTYGIQVNVTREFAAPAGGPQAMTLTYAIASDAGPLIPVVATYSSPDSFLKLEVTVGNPEGLPVKLATFRADLRQ